MAVKSRIRSPDGNVVMESLGWIADTAQMEYARNELKTFHKGRLTYLREGYFEFVDITRSVS